MGHSVQPPRGLSRDDRNTYIRERTHIIWAPPSGLAAVGATDWEDVNGKSTGGQKSIPTKTPLAIQTVDPPISDASVIAVPVAVAAAPWLEGLIAAISWAALGSAAGIAAAAGGVLMMCGSTTGGCSNDDASLSEQSTPAPPPDDGCPAIVPDCSDWEESADLMTDLSEMAVDSDPFSPDVHWGQQEKHFLGHTTTSWAAAC